MWRLNRLRWNALTSMLKTLAAKHGSTVSKMAAKHKAKVETRDGLRTCFEARKHREGKQDLVARFGGITLRQNRRAVIRDPAPAPAPYPRKELIKRLRKRECELCETGTTVAVHQVTGLRELGKPGPGQPAWAALMAKMRRKTLIVCAPCHDGSTRTPSRTRHKSLESSVHRKVHAEFGGRLPGKGLFVRTSLGSPPYRTRRANRAFFGCTGTAAQDGEGSAPFPQLRIVALTTRAAAGPCSAPSPAGRRPGSRP